MRAVPARVHVHFRPLTNANAWRSLAALIMLIFVHVSVMTVFLIVFISRLHVTGVEVGQINTSTVPRGISMVI